MLHKVLPSVVNVRAQIKVTDIETLAKLQKERSENNDANNSGLPLDKMVSIASGVIVDASKGYILTNAHVVDNAETVTVTLGDGHHYTAKIIGIDKPTDIALLQIKAKDLSAITIADSNTLKVGDFLAAIGNPFGLNQTVTSGIVSALGRTTLGIENFENFIQTDAPINPGNSGGALINMEGQLVGINTAILAPDRGSIGIGFAIPSNMAKSIMQQLIDYGNVKRGMLGIAAQDISPDLENALGIKVSKGAVITQVMPNSPAEDAAFKPGDVIVSVNGSEVKTANDVVNTIGFLRVDSKIKVDILRNNKAMSLTATLSDPQKRKEAVEAKNPFLYGVGLKHFTLLSPLHGEVDGILVVTVSEDSNAWHSDLRPGDVIVSANLQKVTSVDALRKIANEAKETLLINVLRGPGAAFLVISKAQ
ncbi:hypothetical protein AYO45_02640 [Gammaproteobacteria bacterium SCGC AG-212-F23]|nr:hypothetical protein AYO45_02640 [Gammaproteobacteria bacterium SCGC AG-212-F23]